MPRRSIPFVLIACFVRVCWAGQPLDALPDTVDKVRKCVGAVGTYNRANRPPMEFSASGFFIDSKGYFLTANHAIETIAKRRRLSDLRVFLPGDKDRVGHPATLVTQETRFDLALLKVEGPAFDALAVADSTEVREGQTVALCGFPFGFLLGLHPSSSAGIISSISPIAIPVVNTRQLDPAMVEALRSPFDVFQLDVTAYPGHSGAPLFEPSTGRVLGVVNSAFIRRTKEKIFSSGISYAIPIHLARKLLDDARKQKTGTKE
jgi:S1-C subfamily serine protease